MGDRGPYYVKVRQAWRQMINRCTNEDFNQFKHYGGRGITVHVDWLGDGGFDRFYAHIGDPPSCKHSVDRVDNDGNYEPGNVKWSTQREQMNNRQRTIWIELDGRRMSLRDWGEELGIPYYTLYQRYKYSKREGAAELLAPARKRVLKKQRESERLIEYQGRTQRLVAWCRELNFRYATVHKRLALGWSVEEALTTPAGPFEVVSRKLTPVS
jgi:hypothetical protein